MFYVESILSHKKFETDNSELIKTGLVFLLDTTYTSNSKLTYLNNNPDSEIFRVICQRCFSEASFKKSDNRHSITQCPFCEDRQDRGFYLCGSGSNLHGYSLVRSRKKLIATANININPNDDGFAIIPAAVAITLQEEGTVEIIVPNFSVKEIFESIEVFGEKWEFLSTINKSLCRRISTINIVRHNKGEQLKGGEDIFKLVEQIQGLPDHSYTTEDTDPEGSYYQCDYFDPDGVGELGTATQIGHKWLIANETKGNHYLTANIDDFKPLNIFLNDGYFQLYKFSDGNIFYANSDFSIVKYFCGSKYQSKEFQDFLKKVIEVCI